MYKIIVIALLVLLAGCGSKQYNERVKEIILHQTQEGLYEITKDHMRCYICETGDSPREVSEVEGFSPSVEYCKPIFTGKAFDSLIPGFTNHKITENKIEGFDDRTIFVFSENGSTYEEIRNNEKQYSMSMPLLNSELDCTTHELLSDQWNRKREEYYKNKRKDEIK